MNIFSAIKQLVKGKNSIHRLSQSPYSMRYTFINSEREIRRLKLIEYKTWFIGDSDELLNFYTNASLFGFNRNIIYNRNAKNYFWSISSSEGNIKRVHSGVPNAIISTLVNIVGIPNIYSQNETYDNILSQILYENDFINLINQQQLPLTLVEGYGAFKINVDNTSRINIEYYEAEDIDYVFDKNNIIGIIFKSYYKVGKENYLLIETRRTDYINSYIEYELFRQVSEEEVIPCQLSEVEELKDLKDKVIYNFPYMLAVPTRIFYDVLNKNYGKSLFAGKVDLFDDLDQALSQSSQTVRVSTPVEYYDPEVLERGKDGQTQMPNVFNRQYIKKFGSLPDGDGNTKDTSIITTQPTLNFNQYSIEARKILDYILTGILSPATMGIDISKRDNALAQREKEKISILTRNNIISRESRIIKQLCFLCVGVSLILNDIEFNELDLKNNISVNFDEFASPTFEQELETLSVAYNRGVLSTRKFINLLYGDKMSEEEKKYEIEYIEREKAKENGAILNENKKDDNLPSENLKDDFGVNNNVL